jgi:hypothetical protein
LNKINQQPPRNQRSSVNRGLASEDTGGQITFTGEDPILPSNHRLGAIMAMGMMGPAAATQIFYRGLLAVAANELREKKATADKTTQQIEDTISALDPTTRAAVIARLTADAEQQVKDRFGH